jgi:hypothetical protein
VPEICSSGLTHVLNENTYEGIATMMDGHTPRIFKASEISMKHNYASLDISKDSEGNVDIEAKVRTIGNVPIISRKFRIAANLSAPVEDGVHSLNFRHAKTRHSAMCK